MEGTDRESLIIGGGGFIGLNVAKYLLANRSGSVTLADYRFDRDLSDYFDEEDFSRLRLITADFTLSDSFESLGDTYDHVYMLASVVGVNNAISHADKVVMVNTKLILNTIEWLERVKVKRVLFSSTSEIYSATTEVFDYSVPTSEDVPICISDSSDPRFSYAITKALGESAFLNSARSGRYEATVVRYHNAYGPDMGFKHVIPHLVQRFMSGETPFKVYGHDQTRAFSFIDDTVSGTVLAIESPEAAGEIIHIGTPLEISIKELVLEVGKLLNYSGEFIDAPTYPGSVGRRCPDISKAKSLLNFEPQVHWREGVAVTVEWYRQFFANNEKPREDGFVSREEFKC